MGEQIVISCGMLMDEVKYVRDKLGYTSKIIWTKRSLHQDPQILHKGLQQLINSNQDKDEILFTFGLCGNGTTGLVSEHTKLVFPRFHDCIQQLLLKRTYKEEDCEQINLAGHYYMTRGWTLDKESLYYQTILIIKRFGIDYGKEILTTLYEDYTDVDVIDTGAYDVERVMKHAGKLAKLMNLTVKNVHLDVNKIPGSTLIIEKLLSGNWDDDFIVLEPGEKLEWSYFFDNEK